MCFLHKNYLFHLKLDIRKNVLKLKRFGLICHYHPQGHIARSGSCAAYHLLAAAHAQQMGWTPLRLTATYQALK